LSKKRREQEGAYPADGEVSLILYKVVAAEHLDLSPGQEMEFMLILAAVREEKTALYVDGFAL
jgi:hypothetical protein